jgi:DNA-binding transcriptional LysR family regulator
MDIPLHLVRTLQAVVSSGNFSRAAAFLHLSQPAVSKHVHLLEERVGLPLLERVGKRPVPTSAGEILLSHAGRALAELDAAAETLTQMQGTVAGRVRLGTESMLSAHVLPPLYRRVRAELPAVELAVMTSTAAGLSKALTAGEVDLAVVTLPMADRSLVATPFFREPLVAIAPREPPWLRLRSVDARRMAERPFIAYPHGSRIRAIVERWFARQHIAPRIVMELENPETVRHLVTAGLGLAICSVSSLGPDQQARSLAILDLEPPLHRQLGVVRRKDKRIGAALNAVLAILEDLRRDIERRRTGPSGQVGKAHPRRHIGGSAGTTS